MFNRSLFNTILTAAIALSTLSLSAQEVSVRRGVKRPAKKENKSHQLTRRAVEQGLNLQLNKDHRRWEKVVYRFLDLSQAENAALYYVGNNVEQENLFAKIFNCLNSGELKAYEYLDGVEIYDQAHELDFKALLDRFQIPYKTTSQRGHRNETISLEVDKNDIPSSDVRAYYVKEVWYFDQAKSDFNVSIEAICPVMFATGDAGNLPYPLFWLPYDKLRPYINVEPVMLNDSNNIAEASFDDFFTLRMYKGDIVKVKNMLNKSLVQQYGVDSIQAKRDSIEQELDSIRTKAFACSPMMNLKAGGDTAEEDVDTDKKENSRDKRIKKAKKSKKKSAKAKHKKSKKEKSSRRASSKSVRGRF